jgi:hypothetical protein
MTPVAPPTAPSANTFVQGLLIVGAAGALFYVLVQASKKKHG